MGAGQTAWPLCGPPQPQPAPRENGLSKPSSQSCRGRKSSRSPSSQKRLLPARETADRRFLGAPGWAGARLPHRRRPMTHLATITSLLEGFPGSQSTGRTWRGQLGPWISPTLLGAWRVGGSPRGPWGQGLSTAHIPSAAGGSSSSHRGATGCGGRNGTGGLRVRAKLEP